MPNPYGTTNTEQVLGVWLTGFYNNNRRDSETQTYINAQSSDAERPLTAEVFEPPTRRSKVVVLGANHGHEGSISGQLLRQPLSGFNYGPFTWAERLRNLLIRQPDYERIELMSRHFWFLNVVLPEGFSLTAVQMPSGGEQIFEVSFSYIQLLGEDED